MSNPPAIAYEPAPHGLQAFTHDAMACTWRLLIADEQAEYAASAARAAFEEVDRLEQELSRYVPHSDISRINRACVGEPTRVGPDVLECLQLAARLTQVTRGAFDVSVGGLTQRGAAVDLTQRGADGVGDRDAGQRGSATTAPIGMMHAVRIDAAARSVTIEAAGVQLDLGAIGKGFAVDRGLQLLTDWSIRAALLSSGDSTVRALGAPSGAAAGWRVALRNPLDPAAVLGHVVLRDAALGGSGRALHGPHIIDPRSGVAAVEFVGAWALAPSAACADALSTAAMVLDESELTDLAAQQRVTLWQARLAADSTEILLRVFEPPAA